MEKPSAAPTDARERLRQHFSSDPGSPGRWEALWKDGTFLPWDKGGANPALFDLLRERGDLIGGPQRADGRRKKALVPGFGKGYDLLLLSSCGYDAYGVEGSASAIETAREYAREHESEYPTKSDEVGRGRVEYLLGDFFKAGWEEGLDFKAAGAFDLIYDYTVSRHPVAARCRSAEVDQSQFLSALPPSLRPAWAARLSGLLALTGQLICLEFPTYKDPQTGGPPWALPPVVYEQHLSYPGEDIKYDDKGHIVVEEGRSSEREQSAADCSLDAGADA